MRVNRPCSVAKFVACAWEMLCWTPSTERYYSTKNRQALLGFLLGTSCLDSFKMFGTSWGTPQFLSHVHISWNHFSDCLEILLEILYFMLHMGGTLGFLFCKFVMSQKWQSCIRWFSQIWLHTRYESRKNPESFYFLGYLLKFIIKISRFGFSFYFS